MDLISPPQKVLVVSVTAVCAAMIFGLYSTDASRPSASESSKGTAAESHLETSPSRVSARMKESYGKLPLSFETNAGQTDARVKFLARGPGYSLFFTRAGAVLSLSSTEKSTEPALGNQTTTSGVPGYSEMRPPERAVVSLQFKNANSSPQITAVDELPGNVNYFVGSDPKKWRTGVRTYAKVRYRNVYRGIDVIYYGNQRQLEYDFVIAPGIDPRSIEFVFKGPKKIELDENGDLVLQTIAGDIRQTRPFAYQDINGVRREIAARFRINRGKVSFRLGRYDKSQPLIIDPVLIYSSPLGGDSTEQGLAIAVDSQGSAFVTGNTDSTDFPLAGALQGTKDVFNDVFVTKLNPAGTALVYSTYIGGDGDEVGNAIAVDAQGSAYVVGVTGSGSFPTTPGVFQNFTEGSFDGFLTKLSPSGSALAYSTFLGGENGDIAFGVAVDADGRAYVVGRTESSRLHFIPLERKGHPLFKSEDGAVQWDPSDSELTATSVNVISQDPSNANTLYAGTNFGVFKSTDAGAHWNLTGTSRTSTAPGFTTAVAVDPSNPNIIYAGTNFGLCKSVDGGPLYFLKNSGLGVPIINALAIDPSTPTTLYAGTAFGIYKTTNGGDNWFSMQLPGGSTRVNEVVIDPTNPATLYIGTHRGMFKTTNNGALWTSINTGALIGGFIQITALVIDPSAPSTLYAGATVSPDVLYKTTDGGANWFASGTGMTYTVGGQSFKPPLVNTLSIDPLTPANVYAATSLGGLYKTTNGGANWFQSNTGLTSTTINTVTVDRSNPATIYVGTNIGADGFFVRLDPAASFPDALLKIGGTDNDEARGVALDSDGNAYIVGTTSSEGFPVQNPFQPAYGGSADAFVTKVNASGTGIIYSTYLGGGGHDQGRAISVSAGNAYVVGLTTSSDFPLVNPLKATLAQFDTDAFVSKFNTAGSALDYSTLLGGSGNDQGFSLAVDTNGSAYITGLTFSSDFPILDAAQPGYNGNRDAFMTKLSAAGTSIAHSTYLGGVDSDQGNGVAVDNLGNAYLVGTTWSPSFPIARGVQSALKGGSDAFVAKIGIEADLSISKTNSRDPVMVSNPLRYTVSINNNGPSPATAVTVSDTLAAGLTFVSASPSQGTCSFSSPTVTCQLGSLPAFGAAIVIINVTPTLPGTVSNTATVQASESDGDPTNNSDTKTTKISDSPSIKGRVRDAGSNGVSALMTLSGAQTATVQTDASGLYQFAELPAGGTYTITPTNSNFSFAPSAQTFPSLSSDQVADFVATPCTYEISPTNQSVAAGGGSGSVSVTSLSGCPWTATSSADWITITSGAAGVGSGTVSFTVSPTTAARAGHLTIAGKNYAVYQEFGACGTPAFAIAKYNLSGRGGRAQTADFNGDGSPDVLISSSCCGSDATVMLNDGTGGFVPSSFSLGEVQGVALADFNGDSRPDVAATSYNSSFVTIFFNNGSGGFGQSIVQIPFISQGQSPATRGLFAADINNDSKRDLLVITPGASAVQVLLGNGAGSFTQQSPIASNYELIALADVDANGASDLILTNSSHQLAIRLGDAAGNFGAPIISSGPGATLSVGTADFDADGKLDIAGYTLTPGPNSTFIPGISIMLGDGTGHFIPKPALDTGGSNQTVADFNRDGKSDVAFTKGEDKVYVALGDGLGGLATPVEIETGVTNPSSNNLGIVAADFNGDTKPDLAVADGSRGASVLRNTCAAAPAISGRVIDSRTTGGLSGVTMTLAGAQSATIQTDGSGNYFFANLTLGSNYVVTPSKASYRFNPVNASINNLADSQVANFVGTPITVQFALNIYLVDENAGFIQIDVNRTGDLSGATTVDYASVNGSALDTSDFTTAVGTLRFGPGEAVKSFNVLVTDDSLVEGWELLTLTLSNPTGAILGSSHTPFLEIRDNDTTPGSVNAIDDAGTFVRQHYYDFLNRVPDQDGLDYWTGQLTECGNNVLCMHQRRVGVSAAYFVENEFQRTGYVVYRMHRAAFGTWPGSQTRLNLTFAKFMMDRGQVAEGADLPQSTIDFANAFVQRPEFLQVFPTSNFSNAQFVNKLFDIAELTPYATERQQQIDAMNAGKTRAQVLLDVIEIIEFKTREYDRAFVLMQYFGYLRRDPDQGGYDFWLNVLRDRVPNNYRAMVCAFLTSTEYQQRFGTAITRSNQDCSQ